LTVSGTLTGLQPSTTYYYRAIVNSPGGMAASSTVASFTTATAAPVLGLSQAATPGVVLPGQLAVFTLTVTNTGARAASDVTLSDAPPTGSTLVNAVTSQGKLAEASAHLLIDRLGTLAPGASATLTVVVTSRTAGLSVNLGVASTPDDPRSTPRMASAFVTIPTGPPVVASTTSRRSITLVFDEPLHPVSARNRANYRLFLLGNTSSGRTHKVRPVPLQSITYQPGSRFVRITTSTSLSPGKAYELDLIGETPGGVADLFDRKLVGRRGGLAGSSAALVFRGA